MTQGDQTDSSWRLLYFMAGAAAVAAVLVFRRNLAAELALFQGFGIFTIPAEQPVRALDWFAAFHEDALAGLLLFRFGDMVNYLLVGLILLALYGALRQINRAAILAAMAAGFVGISVSLATNQALSMLALSNRYAGAATVDERSTLAAAGEALLAIDNPGAAFKGSGYYLGLFLVLAAGLIISIIMLRSVDFPKATPYVGILANSIALAYFAVLFVAPSWIWLPSTMSAPFRIAWYILTAVGLFKLGAGTSRRNQYSHE